MQTQDINILTTEKPLLRHNVSYLFYPSCRGFYLQMAVDSMYIMDLTFNNCMFLVCVGDKMLFFTFVTTIEMFHEAKTV